MCLPPRYPTLLPGPWIPAPPGSCPEGEEGAGASDGSSCKDPPELPVQQLSGHLWPRSALSTGSQGAEAMVLVSSLPKTWRGGSGQTWWDWAGKRRIPSLLSSRACRIESWLWTRKTDMERWQVNSPGLWPLLGYWLTVNAMLCYCFATWWSYAIRPNYMFIYTKLGLTPANVISTNRWPLYQNTRTPRGQLPKGAPTHLRGECPASIHGRILQHTSFQIYNRSLGESLRLCFGDSERF